MVHSINMNSWRFLQISQRNSILAVREILFKIVVGCPEVRRRAGLARRAAHRAVLLATEIIMIDLDDNRAVRQR
jgi:hypothetical protein